MKDDNFRSQHPFYCKWWKPKLIYFKSKGDLLDHVTSRGQGRGWIWGWLEPGLSVRPSFSLLPSLSPLCLCLLALSLLSARVFSTCWGAGLKPSDFLQLSNQRRKRIFPSSFKLKHPGAKLRLVSLTKIFNQGDNIWYMAGHFLPKYILSFLLEPLFLSWAYCCPVNTFPSLLYN